jgi:hypothetical protein
MFHDGLLRGLFFDPEDGGDMFLRNVYLFSTDYKALYPRIIYVAKLSGSITERYSCGVILGFCVTVDPVSLQLYHVVSSNEKKARQMLGETSRP